MSLTWKTSHRRFEHLEKRPLVMGILNVTPDSFSDGGAYPTTQALLARAQEMISHGADILDIGGESTRPGAPEVTTEEELARVIPAIEILRHAQIHTAISIDTRNPTVAQLALAAGAEIVNDVSGLVHPQMQEICAQSRCGIIAMHAQGTPQTMQLAPHYKNVVAEVREFFTTQFHTLTQLGISHEAICFDPGIGFGKSLKHNLLLLKHLSSLSPNHRPLLLGVSRKSLIAKVLGNEDFSRRLAPTIAITAIAQNIAIHRVHDVQPITDALRLTTAIHNA